MVNGTDDVEADKRRAEVFDALGHPTRIIILKALSEGPQGFADLKKKLGIDSSGHLQHHLNKLNDLVKTDEYGKYPLSDQGKDALLSVETVEKATKSGEKQNGKAPIPKKSIILKTTAVALVLLLIMTSALAAIEYNKTQSLQNALDERDSKTLSLQSAIDERDSQISQLNDVISGRDALITQLDTVANWDQSLYNMKPPAASQYLATSEENQTKIFLVSTAAGYQYGSSLPYPFNNTPWSSGSGPFSSRRVLELTDNRSVAVSFWGWSLGGGNYQMLFRGGDPYLMIGVTVRNDYTAVDTKNGTDGNAPIGRLPTGSYVSIINLAVTLYSWNGSVIPSSEAADTRSSAAQPVTATGGYRFLLGSNETKQAIFYISPSSLDIDHYEIHVSSLSAQW